MMIRMQVAIAVIVGYWLGRARHTKLAAAGAGRLAGSPQEMVDHAATLLEASPEFAALDESVRGQLLDAVKVAAVTAGTTRSDVDIDRLLPHSGDEILRTAQDLAVGAVDQVDDLPADDVETDRDDDTDDEEPVADASVADASTADERSAAAPSPSTAEVRAWAREHGFPVSDRGRLRAEVWEAYTDAHPER
ncbi:Lsr2 family DNA-binding protein [Rhodococcus koreensis]|uniref:Lsr2 protein n=1 Tax=Rhodococcus koreensis TaxID=99653 RepID=A0A1H5C4Q5_9NOCA|nr:histone-like nucleoid-structuring protein Lsr2 [Rhodococcus koreensis]SED61451.1 Lsr2 protein [Rhodococcus koreensis]